MEATMNYTEKTMNLLKKSLFIIFNIIFILSLSGCNMKINPKQNIVYTSNDVEGIHNLFPDLEGIESCEWEQVQLNNTKRFELFPSPTDYKYQGYIQLTDEQAEKYIQEYGITFNSASPNITFVSIEKHRNKLWKFSGEFDKQINNGPNSGYIYFDGENELLFSVIPN